MTLFNGRRQLVVSGLTALVVVGVIAGGAAMGFRVNRGHPAIGTCTLTPDPAYSAVGQMVIAGDGWPADISVGVIQYESNGNTGLTFAVTDSNGSFSLRDWPPPVPPGTAHAQVENGRSYCTTNTITVLP